MSSFGKKSILLLLLSAAPQAVLSRPAASSVEEIHHTSIYEYGLREAHPPPSPPKPTLVETEVEHELRSGVKARQESPCGNIGEDAVGGVVSCIPIESALPPDGEGPGDDDGDGPGNGDGSGGGGGGSDDDSGESDPGSPSAPEPTPCDVGSGDQSGGMIGCIPVDGDGGQDEDNDNEGGAGNEGEGHNGGQDGGQDDDDDNDDGEAGDDDEGEDDNQDDDENTDGGMDEGGNEGEGGNGNDGNDGNDDSDDSDDSDDNDDDDDDDDGAGVAPVPVPGPPGPPGGGGTPGNEGDNNSDNDEEEDNDDDQNDDENEDEEEDEDEDEDDEEEDGCAQTVICTQTCTLEPDAKQTTTLSCEEDEESFSCETQTLESECSPTTTTTETSTTEAAVTGACGLDSGCGDHFVPDGDFCRVASTLESPEETPGPKPPSLEDFFEDPETSLQKRVEEDWPPFRESPIMHNDFIDLSQFQPGGRDAWWVWARSHIDQFGAQNFQDQNTGNDDYSSKMWSIKDLTVPFITGAGPSWGCTSVMVFSDKGIWLAHFWETTNIMDPDDFEKSLDFMEEGDEQLGFPSLAKARERYFRRDDDAEEPALFVRAYIFTPSAETTRVTEDGEPFPGSDRTRQNPTDPWWNEEVDDITAQIRNLVPDIEGQDIHPITYTLFPNQENRVGELGFQERTLAAFQYVPQRLHQVNDMCYVGRAIRILHPFRQETDALWWPWPANQVQPDAQGESQGGTQGEMQKRQNGGSELEFGQCPNNVEEFLDEQDVSSENDKVFDPDNIMSGEGDSGGDDGNDEDGDTDEGNDGDDDGDDDGGEEEEEEDDDNEDDEEEDEEEEDDEDEEEERPLCSNLELGPITGSDIHVGTGCQGHDPDERITFTVNQARAIATAIPSPFVA